jgi:hypothetical protein
MEALGSPAKSVNFYHTTVYLYQATVIFRTKIRSVSDLNLASGKYEELKCGHLQITIVT